MSQNLPIIIAIVVILVSSIVIKRSAQPTLISAPTPTPTISITPTASPTPTISPR